MNKKVAIVVCAWPPQGGGIGNNAYYQLRELKQAGYQVTAFTPRYRREVDGEGVKYLFLFLPWGKAGFLFSLFWRLKDFEVIHLYYPFFGTDLVVWWLKLWQPNKKLVLHYQMDPVGRGGQKIFFKVHLKLFLPLLVRASNKIGVLSYDHAKNTYLNIYLNIYPKKFTELPNGIDTAIFKIGERNQRLAEKYGLKDGDQTIIFVGGLDDQHFFKGVDVLLAAFAQVRSTNSRAKLLIVGDGNRKDYFVDLARRLEVAEAVIFTGWVANEQLPAYYRLAEVFVLPSTERTESFGIVTAEAQACGLPALVADWPGSRQTIEPGKTGWLVEPKNATDLAEKISALLADEKLRRQLGQAAARRAQAKYSWNELIKKYLASYE